MKIASDLDLTLWYPALEHVNEQDLVSDEQLQACRPSRIALRNLHDIDADIVFISGRQEILRNSIERKLRGLGFQDPEVHLQLEWEGYDVLAEWKADVLRSTRADIMIGDHETDARAAEMAEIPFMDALQWQSTMLRNPNFCHQIDQVDTLLAEAHPSDYERIVIEQFHAPLPLLYPA